MTNEQKTPKQKIRAWVAGAIEGEGRIELPDLTERAVAAFAADPEIVASAVREWLRPQLYNIVQQVVASTRTHVMAGDAVIDRAALDDKAKGRRLFSAKWTGWMEHVGDRHVRLTEMTRDDFLAASGERMRRGEHEIKLGHLWRSIASMLGPEQNVTAIFDDVEQGIEGLYRRIERTVAPVATPSQREGKAS